jgi:hypothetical protein
MSVIKRSAVDAIAGGFDHGPVRPVECVSCHERMFADHVSESLTGQCRSCQISDAEDYAGITREEARADDHREGFDDNGELTIDLDDYEPED